MMKGTGKGGSDESEDVSEIEEDEDEDDLDDLDALDRMASEVLPKAGGAAEGIGGGGGGTGGGGDGGGGKKRKSPPPADGVTITGYTPVSRAVEDAEIEATAAKKARIAAAVPSPPVSPTAVSGPPTEEEVTAFIQARGRMLLKDLSQAFTARLKTKEEKQNFSGLIKKVVKLVTGDDGKKYVVLKKATS
jgi:transcription initiation factor TFIIF subunit alpha